MPFMLLVLALCIEQWPNQIPAFGAQTQSSTCDTASEWGKRVRMGRQGGMAGQLSGPGWSGEALSRLLEEAMSEQRPEWSEDWCRNNKHKGPEAGEAWCTRGGWPQNVAWSIKAPSVWRVLGVCTCSYISPPSSLLSKRMGSGESVLGSGKI